jgi:hypothetical protein
MFTLPDATFCSSTTKSPKVGGTYSDFLHLSGCLYCKNLDDWCAGEKDAGDAGQVPPAPPGAGVHQRLLLVHPREVGTGGLRNYTTI